MQGEEETGVAWWPTFNLSNIIHIGTMFASLPHKGRWLLGSWLPQGNYGSQGFGRREEDVLVYRDRVNLAAVSSFTSLPMWVALVKPKGSQSEKIKTKLKYIKVGWGLCGKVFYLFVFGGEDNEERQRGECDHPVSYIYMKLSKNKLWTFS